MTESGTTLKELGLDKVEINNKTFVEVARTIAKEIVRLHGQVTTDDIRAELDRMDLMPKHKNAFGAIFRGKEWRCIDWRKSTRPSNHARMIGVWTCIGERAC